jgi:hypothetical protein
MIERDKPPERRLRPGLAAHILQHILVVCPAEFDSVEADRSRWSRF